MADGKPKKGRRRRESLDVDLGDTGTGLKDLAVALGDLKTQISALNKSFSILGQGQQDAAKGVAYLVSGYEDLQDLSLGVNSLTEKNNNLLDARRNTLNGISSSYGDITSEIANGLRTSLADTNNLKSKDDFVQKIIDGLKKEGKLQDDNVAATTELRGQLESIYENELKRKNLGDAINVLTEAQTKAANTNYKLAQLQKQEIEELE
jgi:hypothetical protein